jgi:hypothetical protein
MKGQRGQLLIVIAIVVSIAMLLLAVAVDGGRLFLERNRIARGAQAAADAGVGLAAEEMVGFAEERRDEALEDYQQEAQDAQEEWEEACKAGLTDDEEVTPADPGINCDEEPEPEPFEPCEPEPQCWLEDEDWVKMDSSSVRDQVELESLEYARANGFERDDPNTLKVEVEYEVDKTEESIQVRVTIERRTTIVLVGLLGGSFVNLEAEGLSELLK